MADGRAWYKIREEIPPQSSRRIQFLIMLDQNSAKVYYESLFWHIDLLLRDKLIERRSSGIRVVPSFRPDLRTDVLLVTNSQVNRAEFLAYQKLFQLFNYTSQTWSIERYGTLDNPGLKWLHTADLIIFIYWNPESTFKLIKCESLLEHIRSSEKADFISIGACSPDELDFVVFDYTNRQYLNAEERAKTEATNHLWSGFGCGQPSIESLIEKANKFRSDFEKQDDHRFLYQIVYDDTIDTTSSGFCTVVYGNKYVYKSILDCQLGPRLIMVTSDNPLITTSHLPFLISDSLDKNQTETTDPSNDECQIDVGERSDKISAIQSDIDLNSRFGRLICAILSYQGFERAYSILREQQELSLCTFKKISNRFSFHQILVALAMSIIEREYDRGSLEFPSTHQLLTEISHVIAQEGNTTNGNGWLYLVIQSLYAYIDSKFFSSFPWCCGFTIKSKQRTKLQLILNDLLSLIATEIPKNKQVYPEVENLKLQQITNLKFPIADRRETCVRSMAEIQAWQSEQQSSRSSN